MPAHDPAAYATRLALLQWPTSHPLASEALHDHESVGRTGPVRSAAIEGRARGILADLQEALRRVRRARVGQGKDRTGLSPRPLGDHPDHGRSGHGLKINAGALFLGRTTRHEAVMQALAARAEHRPSLECDP